jgi:hypothetical protein
MTGKLSCPMRTGQLFVNPSNQIVEIFGVTVAEVNDKLQITQLETFFNPNDLMQQLAKNKV